MIKQLSWLLLFTISFLVFFALFMILTSSVCNAQQVDPGQVVTLKKGEPAPFAGSLLSPWAVAKILAEKDYQEKQCALDKSMEVARVEAKCNLDKSKLEVEKDTIDSKLELTKKYKDEEITRLNDALKKVSSNNDYHLLWAAGGTVVGILTSIGIFFAASYANK